MWKILPTHILHISHKTRGSKGFLSLLTYHLKDYISLCDKHYTQSNHNRIELLKQFSSLAHLERKQNSHISVFTNLNIYNTSIKEGNNLFRMASSDTAGNFRLFEEKDHAQYYALYRPSYPEELYSRIYDYCKSHEGYAFSKALDIACGSGQSTQPLKKKFDIVLGQDVSEAQITEAQKHASETNELRIDYSVGRAEDLSSMENATVDLITCAQSFHWFDFEKVYKEVKRVLRPSGVFAIYGYGNIALSESSATEVTENYFHNTLRGYWPPERDLVTSRFSGFQLPFDDFQRFDDLKIERQLPLSSLIGYLKSWSATQKLYKAHPESKALEDVRKRLSEIYKADPLEDFMIDVHWPVYVLMGRNSPS